jgi:hypothetical protein
VPEDFAARALRLHQRQPEVGQDGAPFLVKHDVGGLEVAVNHAACGHSQRAGKLRPDPQYVFERHQLAVSGVAFEHPAQVGASMYCMTM